MYTLRYQYEYIAWFLNRLWSMLFEPRHEKINNVTEDG